MYLGPIKQKRLLSFVPLSSTLVLRIGVEWESLTLETKNKKGGKLGAGRTFGQRNSYL